MILVSGSHWFTLNPLTLSELERKILQDKQRSQAVYQYRSIDALEFELKMRKHTVEAAKALFASRASFATFARSKCNMYYWTRTGNGGFRLNRGVLPSTGINDIFINGNLYGFECAVAIIIIFYKAVLDTVGEAVFNTYFQNLFLRDWQYDRDLRLITADNIYEAYPGDALYFKNPEHDPATPEWQGENVIMLDDNLYFGHGIGIETGQGIIAALNRMRWWGSRISAYLQDIIVFPDFEYLRSLSVRGVLWDVKSTEGQDVIVARIGASTVIFK